jgi:hypothetical protein
MKERIDLDVGLGRCLGDSVSVWFGVPVVLGYSTNSTSRYSIGHKINNQLFFRDSLVHKHLQANSFLKVGTNSEPIDRCLTGAQFGSTCKSGTHHLK